jgi:glucosamine--fructose-6-phosphate aminotransferase (isomerizing)
MTRLLRDIMGQPDELTRSLDYTLGPGRESFSRAAAVLRDARCVLLAGIGSSWHAGMPAQAFFLDGGRPVCLVDASELLYSGKIPARSVLVMLSRSGRSVEVVRLLDGARAVGATVIGVTNAPESPLGQGADLLLPLHAAYDHAVSITMYTAPAMIAALLAAAALGTLPDTLEPALRKALADAKAALPAWQTRLDASDWPLADAPTYFLARGPSQASAHEARLLWEEAAKSPATALTTGGFRHGPQEIVREGLQVAVWLDGERRREADLALVADLRRLGARVLLVGQDVSPDAADLVLPLPPIPAPWQFLIEAIPIQLAVERLAARRGVDCDSFAYCSYVVEQENGLIASAEQGA